MIELVTFRWAKWERSQTSARSVVIEFVKVKL